MSQPCIVEHADANPDFLRRKTLSAHNEATMRAVINTGKFVTFVTFVTDEPKPQGGTGEGPSPLQAVLGALCGCEAVTFNRTAADLGFDYDSLDFEAAFTIDIRGRLGDRKVRPHFQTVRVRAVVATQETPEAFAAVVDETEARCPVMNLIVDAGVDLEVEWVRDAD